MAGLNPGTSGVFVDCTLGGGGHAHALLSSTGAGVQLVGLDQDSDALRAAAIKLAPFQGRFTLIRANFARLGAVLEELSLKAVDGFLFDLGVSSYQLDSPRRGFGYMHHAPLDMRMDQEGPVTAGDLIRDLPEKELAAIIRRYGEERWAARIANFIVRARAKRPIVTTTDLVDIIKQAIPAPARREGPHPARRTFQALRIAVNNELEILAGALGDAVEWLRPGGRICVITFHSLEDRIVKDTLRELANPCQCPPSFPVCNCGLKPKLAWVGKGVIRPTKREIAENPRSRSAKLRVAEKMACSK